MFDLFKKPQPVADRPPEQKASSVKASAWASGSGSVAWSSRDRGALMRLGFTGNPIVFRAVKLIAEAAANLPLQVLQEDQVLSVHAALSLLQRPNEGQGQNAFLEALYGQLLLTGDAYVEGVSDMEALRELYVLRSDRMQVVPGADGWPVAYDYRLGGKAHRFHKSALSPICHLKAFHPQDDHYGLSPMQAAAQAIDVHSAASHWSKALLDNAARPSGALVYSSGDGTGGMTPEQYDRLSVEIEANHIGARNAGRPMLLEGGLDWKPMAFSPSDMEFHKTKEAAAREIAIAFGVPPMMLGVPGEATYANYQEANRAFYRLTILPLVDRVLEGLAAWISTHTGENIALKVDLDKVAALTPERDAQWKRITSADFLTRAEKRQLLGLPVEAEEAQHGG